MQQSFRSLQELKLAPKNRTFLPALDTFDLQSKHTDQSITAIDLPKI